MTIPSIALSIRQPWAWAIVHGGKDVENRTTFAVTKGGFTPRPVAIHAARGMTRAEYEDAAEFMARLGVTCPPPAELVRGAIVGTATVTAVVKQSASPWFMGPRGLLLADQTALSVPIPATGALGYFAWAPGGECADPLPWMLAWPAHPGRNAPAAPSAPLFDMQA